MSLLNDAFEKCTMLIMTREPDGLGGYDTIWKDGTEFDAAITYQNSLQAQIAEKQGVTSLYKITTRKVFPLNFHDVVRRESDKQIFRVTTDGADYKTPAAAGLDMCVVNAEKWELTT